MIDQNPDRMRKRHSGLGETIAAATKYLNTSKDLIALTESSTMAMAIVLNGFIFKKVMKLSLQIVSIILSKTL